MNAYQNPAPEEDTKTSKINAAGLINATLEKLWNDSYYAMSQSRYDAWNIKLDAIWLILGADTTEGDDTEKIYNKIDLDLYSYGSLGSKTEGFKKIGTKGENKSLQYLTLKKKALFLRRLQNNQGKGTAYKTTDDFDFE